MYVHDNGYLHLDIKPDNIFLDKHEDSQNNEINAKLGDLGISEQIKEPISDNENQSHPLFVGTRGFWPPELRELNNSNYKVNTWTDVFSLCLTFHILGTMTE